jgi:hypothetical protein
MDPTHPQTCCVGADRCFADTPHQVVGHMCVLASASTQAAPVFRTPARIIKNGHNRRRCFKQDLQEVHNNRCTAGPARRPPGPQRTEPQIRDMTPRLAP